MGSMEEAINEEENYLFAMHLVGASVLPMVMKVSIEMDLFEIIAKAGPGALLSPNTIASQLSIKNPNAVSMLDRALRLLASFSVLTSSVVRDENGVVERLYGLASVCKYFVKNEDGVSLSPLLQLVQSKVFMDSWYHMKDAILEGGIPFNRAHGMHSFEYPGIDPEFNKIFNGAMFSHSSLFIKRVLEVYTGFDGLKEVIDVGGGVGTTINLITSKHPTIKGINFDLPHVIQHAPSYPGVEHVGGDMFDCVPSGEAIFMKWILHDWSDEDCVKLLKNCYKALPDHGKVILVEGILPVAVETNPGVQSLCEGDLIMMSQNTGGKERLEEEFENLAKGAGFARMTKACSFYNHWVIELYKK
uniref:Caffeic acid 3-O-methyltransferase cytoplasmic n=1 Tax=Nigella sativa TaxID=555479 RepID=A0A899GV88_NIGSA|nr:caffeic acid 3-O-methyltransferase cytoplasmic [Nigella sativa]